MIAGRSTRASACSSSGAGNSAQSALLDLVTLRADHPSTEIVWAVRGKTEDRLFWCGSVAPHGVDELAHPEPDVFAVGMKSYGRSTSFLMATGYGQVRSVAAALAGDRAAARNVEPQSRGVFLGHPACTPGAAGIPDSCCW